MTGARRGRDTKINMWFKFYFVLFCFPPLVLWIKWMVFIWEDNIKNKVIAYAKNDSAAAAAKLLQSCPTLCNSIDGSSPGSPVPGILQARTLEWFAISFSNAWKWKMKVKSLSCVWLFTTPWTVAYQAPPSMGSSRQEYWSGVPLPSPKNDST